MAIDMEHLLAVVVVVRVGSADLWTVIRRLLSAGVRIGTEEQLARQTLARRTAAGNVRITYGEKPPEIEGRGI